MEAKQMALSMLRGIILYAVYLTGFWKAGSMFFRKKENAVWKYPCFFLFVVLENGLFAGNYLVNSITRQALLVLFFFTNFRGDGWEKSGFSSAFVSVWELMWQAQVSAWSIFHILLSEKQSLPCKEESGGFAELFFLLVAAVCTYLLFCRTRLSEGNFLHGGGKLLFPVSWFLLLLMDLCSFGITRGIVMVSDGSGIAHWNTTQNEILTHLEVLVLSVLCMVIALSLLFGMNRLVGYFTAENLHKMEIARYKSILEEYKKQANVRHDLKNHLISLSALAEHGEWEKLKDYLSKLRHAGMIGEEEIETGNRVTNAIVNTKWQEAAQKNIKFECNINLSKPLKIDDYDLCILWGNILDNAIKAASVSEERYVFVQAEIVKRNFIISVKNSVESNFSQKDFVNGVKSHAKSNRSQKDFVNGVKNSVKSERLQKDFVNGMKNSAKSEHSQKNFVNGVKSSAKAELPQKEFGIKNWGTGLKNVNKIVQKENGIMEIEIKGAVFDISIMLPVVDCDAGHDIK